MSIFIAVPFQNLTANPALPEAAGSRRHDGPEWSGAPGTQAPEHVPPGDLVPLSQHHVSPHRLNSDVYDNFVNPRVAGNGGAIDAGGPPSHDMPASAEIVIPANAFLVFARDAGDR